MTPAQLQSIASLHAISQGAQDTDSDYQPASEGTVHDLMAFASMRRA